MRRLILIAIMLLVAGFAEAGNKDILIFKDDGSYDVVHAYTYKDRSGTGETTIILPPSYSNPNHTAPQTYCNPCDNSAPTWQQPGYSTQPKW